MSQAVEKGVLRSHEVDVAVARGNGHARGKAHPLGHKDAVGHALDEAAHRTREHAAVLDALTHRE